MTFIPTIVEALRESQRITIITYRTFYDEAITTLLEDWKSDGALEDFHILPDFRSSELHREMVRVLPALHKKRFDTFISQAAFYPHERYITDAALPAECFVVRLWPSYTDLTLRHQRFTQFLLNSRLDAAHQELKRIEKSVRHLKVSLSQGLGQLRRLSPTQVLAALASLRREIRLSPPGRPLRGRILDGVARLETKSGASYGPLLQRVILPFIACRKVFAFRKHDLATRMGIKGIDALLLSCPANATAYSRLIPSRKIHLIEYPVATAPESLPSEDGTLLCLLPIRCHPQDVFKSTLAYLTRDLQAVIKHAAIARVTLRPHPRLPPGTTDTLFQHLKARLPNVAMTLDREMLPFSRIAARYRWIFGGLSTAFFEARVAAPETRLVCSEALTHSNLELNPSQQAQFDLALAGGWDPSIRVINADGSFEPTTFSRDQTAPQPRLQISDTLKKIIPYRRRPVL